MKKLGMVVVLLGLVTLPAVADKQMWTWDLYSRCVSIQISGGAPYQLQTDWSSQVGGGGSCNKPDAYTGNLTSHCINLYEMSQNWHQVPGCSCFTHIQAITPTTINDACTTWTGARYESHVDCGQ